MTSTPPTPDSISALPTGRAPQPLPLPHFPDILRAVVWRNWDIVALDKLAQTLCASPEQIASVARSMGLPPKRDISALESRRNYMTLLRRNWHLLPYEQLLQLLEWSPAQLQFLLNEDDFMWNKLGSYKPQCPPLRYSEPSEDVRARATELGQLVRATVGDMLAHPAENPFDFIDRFSGAAATPAAVSEDREGFAFSTVYPYFLRYGDPLKGDGIDDIPESYLAELSASGVNTLWLQGVLNTLAPWDLAPELSTGWEERLANLTKLTERCKRFGMKVFLYLNEPRAMPHAFYERYPELRGINETEGRIDYMPDIVALCTSTPEVQDFLVNSVQHVFETVPDLGGIVAITYSENLTNCHSRDDNQNATGVPGRCPRCAERSPGEVNGEVCALLERGMRQAGSNGDFVLYTWNTPEEWFPDMVAALPQSTWLMCISEWGQTFTRGDYTGAVNEYSLSVLGPSDECRRKWKLGQERGLKLAAKMQAATTYEFFSIPYIPVLRQVAEHLENVTADGVNGVMLGWTTGGSPSPNLEMVAEYAGSTRPSVPDALLAVATRRFGAEAAAGVVEAWNIMSDAYLEFPFDISVCYAGPQSLGPANLLFAEPTGLKATMCTYPFDDLKTWRGPYSEATFQNQFDKLADLWKPGVELLEALRQQHPSPLLDDEWRIAEAAWIHFRSTANQINFIRRRDNEGVIAADILREEEQLAIRLMHLVAEDSRLGFEATNQYAYTLLDLTEKVINCRDLLKQAAAI